jgi:hypothetical protein
MNDPLAINDDPRARAFADSLPIEEKSLDWMVEQLPARERGAVLGDITAVKRPEGWGIALERRIGLDPTSQRIYETWARERAYRLIVTDDPTVDGWHHYNPDQVDTGEECWSAACLRVDMPDPTL